MNHAVANVVMPVLTVLRAKEPHLFAVVHAMTGRMVPMEALKTLITQIL